MEELARRLAAVFEEEFKKVLQREIDQPDFLSQDEFIGSKTPCTDRADRLIIAALGPVVNTLGLAVAESRTLDKGENHSTEMVNLEAVLSDELIDLAKAPWWRG